MTAEVSGNPPSQVNWGDAQESFRSQAPGNTIPIANPASRPAAGLAFGQDDAPASAPAPVSFSAKASQPPWARFDPVRAIDKAYEEFRDARIKLEVEDIKGKQYNFQLAEAGFRGAIFEQMAKDAAVVRATNTAMPADLRVAGNRVIFEFGRRYEHDQNAIGVGRLAVRQMVDVRATDKCVIMLSDPKTRDGGIEGMADWVVNGNGVDSNTRDDQLHRLVRIDNALKEHRVKDRDAVLSAVKARAEQLGLKSAASANSPSPLDPYK